MRFFLNLSIRWKLVLGFSIGAVSLLLVAGTAVFTMNALRDSQAEIQEIQLNNVIDYLALDANLSRNRVLLHRLMRCNDQGQREALKQDIAVTSAGNNAIMQRLSVRVMRDPLPPDKFAALQASRDAFNRIRDTQIIPAILAGRMDEAQTAFDAADTELYRETSALVAELAGLAKENAHLAVQNSIALVRRAILMIVVIGLAGIGLSVAVIILLHRVIAVPITVVAEAAAKIDGGELELSTPGAERADEIGVLAGSFNRMSASLQDLASIADRIADGDLTGHVRPRSKRDRLAISFDIMSENLKGLAGEMKSGAAEVSAATVDILELTREFLVEMTDRSRAGRFQAALLRLEEVGKRLNAVVGRLRL